LLLLFVVNAIVFKAIKFKAIFSCSREKDRGKIIFMFVTCSKKKILRLQKAVHLKPTDWRSGQGSLLKADGPIAEKKNSLYPVHL
jgi:hypothetical protein